MTRKRDEIARLKLQMLDLYLINPKMIDAEMALRLGLDNHTVAKWKREWETKLASIKEQVEKELELKISTHEGIWQQIIKKLKLK